MDWPKVVLYGDSLTQFCFTEDGQWGSLLARKLERKCDILNRGFSGYNSRWNKLMLPRLFNSENLKNVVAFTVFLGANDSNIKEQNERQHVPLDEFKNNIIEIVKELERTGVTKDKIILIGAPPCDEAVWGPIIKSRGKPMGKSNKLAEDYSKACESAAKELGVDFVELHNSMSKEENWGRFLMDGLHLSQEGSVFLDNKLWPFIEKRTKDLPMILPAWDEVDYMNPQAMFL